MGQSRFESLSQELPSVLQSLEDKRRELKSQGHKAGLWGGILFFIAGGILLVLFGYPVILLLFVGVVSALIYYACVNSKSKDFSLHGERIESFTQDLLQKAAEKRSDCQGDWCIL